jgi:ABC-2 type transport system ATP-binding protein
MSEPTVAIEVRDLTVRYGASVAVAGISFAVQRGEVFALLGPNGAGKTSTLEVLEGFNGVFEGEVSVMGLDPRRDLAALRPRVGLMLQEGGLYPSIHPAEAMRLFASFYAEPLDPDELLNELGLGHVARTRFRNLSGGEKQRLSLGLALVGQPELVFLDEPTAAMDPQARRATWAIIERLTSRGVTVLLTTHYLEEAERLANRVAILNHGQLVALDSPGALRSHNGPSTIRFSAAPAIELNGLAAMAGARDVREVEPGEYVIDGPVSPRVVSAVAEWLAARDVLVHELRVSRDSLEDVYLRITARERETP